MKKKKRHIAEINRQINQIDDLKKKSENVVTHLELLVRHMRPKKRPKSLHEKWYYEGAFECAVRALAIAKGDEKAMR